MTKFDGFGSDKTTVINTGTVLTEELIEQAAADMIANSGKSIPHMMIPNSWGSLYKFMENPQYEGLPWAVTTRLTKREHAVAKLHMFLFNLEVLKNLDITELEYIRNKSIKTLKKAKWARYQMKKKVQSSL
jgi:hypothetical protein